MKTPATLISELRGMATGYLPDGDSVNLSTVMWAERWLEALRQSQSLPAGAVDHATAMEGWFSAIDDADELFVNAPDQRFASRASRVVTYLKANKPTSLQADAREKGESAAWRVQTPYGVGYTFAEEMIAYMNDRSPDPVEPVATKPAGEKVKMRNEDIETLKAIRSAFVGIPAPCAELDALDAAIAALTHPQPVTPAGREVAVYNGMSMGGLAFATLTVAADAIPLGTKLYTHPPVADAALVRDAERYRWLRNPDNIIDGITPDPAGEVLDARIDKAIAALNQRGGGDHG